MSLDAFLTANRSDHPRLAAIVVDMVEDMFTAPETKARRPGLVSAINRLTADCRATGGLVIWVHQHYESDLADAPLEYRAKQIKRTIRGTAGAEFLADLEIDAGDPVILKMRYSPFFRTDLEGLLVDAGITEIAVAGVNTHACVRSTAIDAYQRDYPTYVIRDGVASYDARHHDVSMQYLDGKIAVVMGVDEFIRYRAPR